MFQAFLLECAELKVGAWTPLMYVIYAFVDYCTSKGVHMENAAGYVSDLQKRTALLDWLNEHGVKVSGSSMHPVAVGLSLVRWPRDI